MKIDFGKGKTQFGPGVDIILTGEDVVRAIEAYLVAHDVHITGPRTILVNGQLIDDGKIYVDPSGGVIAPDGREFIGIGAKESGMGELDFWSDEKSADMGTAVSLLKKYLFMEKLTPQEIRTAVDLVIGHGGEDES